MTASTVAEIAGEYDVEKIVLDGVKIELSHYAKKEQIEQVVKEEIEKTLLNGGSTTETLTKVLKASDFEKGGLSSAAAEELDLDIRIRTGLLECTKNEPYAVSGNRTELYKIYYYKDGLYCGCCQEWEKKDCESVFDINGAISDATHIRIALSYETQETIVDISDLVNKFVISRTYDMEVPVVDTSQFVTKTDFKKNLEEYALPTKGKSLLIFGDSITETATVSDDGVTYTESVRSNWPLYAKEQLQVSEMWNYAASGAKWTDFETSTVRQKLSHQIESAIANNRPADIIVISAGTNNNNSGVTDTFDTAISKEIDALDKTVFSEAARWCMYTLRNAYPEAVCFVATPIQRAAREIDKALIEAIVSMAKRYNFIVIPAHDESGIVKDFEVKNSEGRDLIDGTHPNEQGQKKISKLYCNYILRNMNTT